MCAGVPTLVWYLRSYASSASSQRFSFSYQDSCAVVGQTMVLSGIAGFPFLQHACETLPRPSHVELPQTTGHDNGSTLSSMWRSFWATARMPMAASGWRSWLLMLISASTALSGVAANSSSL